MKRIITALFAALALFASASTLAARNAAPMGFEIGVATIEQVKASIGSKTALQDGGINAYSDGHMLKGEGKGLDVAGLQRILFIFDSKGVLSAVRMTLAKDGFRTMAGQLRGKYKVNAQQLPFVGDAWVHYYAGESLIELDAPHLSFEMSLTYLSKTFQHEFHKRRAAERAAEAKEQAAKL